MFNRGSLNLTARPGSSHILRRHYPANDFALALGRTQRRLTARYPEMTVEDSYAVQQLWRRRNEDLGRRLVCRKIGLTSRAMQAATGITERDYGAIFDDMVLENGCSLPCDRYTHPRVEVELAFVLKKSPTRPRVHHFRRAERHGLRGSGA